MIAFRRAVFVVFVVGLGLSITLSQAALGLLALLWLWRLRDPAVRVGARWPLWRPVLAFSAVTLASAMVSRYPAAGLAASKGLLLAAALYVTADALPGPEAARRFLVGLATVAAIEAVVGLLQVGLCPGPEPDYGSPSWLYHRCSRARGFFSIFMTLAGVLNLMLLATLPLLLSGRALARWLIPPWVLMLAALAATDTRGAWVGFVSGALVLLFMTRRGGWLLVGGLLVLGLVATLGPQHFHQRFLSIGDPGDRTVKERIHMWRSGLAMWRTSPWLGVGPGGVKREYGRYALPEAVKQRTGHLHNTPLQILVERGVIGLAAWLWIWVGFYAHAVGLLRRLPGAAAQERALIAGSLAAITGFLVAGLTEYNFGDSEVAMVAWAIMAVPFAVGGRVPQAEPAGSLPAGRDP